MRSRYSLTSSPLKKAPSVYKRTPKKKFSITNQNSQNQTIYSTQYENIITDEIVEEKATPKKSTPRKPRDSSLVSQKSPSSPNNEMTYRASQETSRNSTLNRSFKNRTMEDTFCQTDKQTRPIEDLKSEYQELASLYNNALQIRENLKNDCSSLENELQNTYKQQSKLCHQLKKKADPQSSTKRK